MTQPAPGEEIDQLSAALVVYAARLVRAVSRRTSRDVSAATLRLLSQLDELGPTGVSSLAHTDRCSQPTMSAAVTKLTDRGWASKSPNPDDARSSLVRLTDAGLAVLTEARRRNAAVIADRLHRDPRNRTADLRTAVVLLERLLEQDPEPDPDPRPDPGHHTDHEGHP